MTPPEDRPGVTGAPGTPGADDTPMVVDVVVVGAGPVGENLGQYATEGTDLSAVLIEAELVGGECSYYACMPSKALLRPAEVAQTVAHLPGVRDAALDTAAVLGRRDTWVNGYEDDSQVDWATSTGLEVLRGRARLVGERLVQVSGTDGDRLVQARRAVVLATGSEPVVPEMYADAAPWGSRDATGVVEVPERLAIIGGGVVACEAATWLAALGAHVTLLVRGDRVLPRVEPFASERVAEALGAAGVKVRLGAEVTACRRDRVEHTGLGRLHGGPVLLELAGESGETLEVDELLVATGRRPRLSDVGLDSVGLDASAVLEGRTPDWLVAVGDASGEAPLTHWGKYRARVLGEEIAAGTLCAAPAVEADTEDDVETPALASTPLPTAVPVPQVIFTDPQVGSVGMTESEARAAGHRVVTSRAPWTAAAGAALLRDDVEGGAMFVVDEDSHLLLGATFVGPGAGELVHAATVAIVGAVPVHVLRHAVPSYPTASELWLRLIEDLPPRFRRPPAGQEGGLVPGRSRI